MKNIIEENEKITVNTKEIEILKKYFPNCFNKNGEFQMDKFEKRISKEVDVTKEGYELRWLGKNYARLLANIETETMIVDDEEHNNKRENKNSENIYIEGDNIDVLKHLKNAYSEKIKMIYIDPPYNTGSDGFVYKDARKYTKEDLAELTNITEEEAQRILSFNTKGSNSHSAWLTFMYPRLLTARELLSDDGVIFISIDDNEVSQLKLLCDEVFGEENFVTSFIWKKGKEGGNDSKIMRSHYDYILTYAKNSYCKDIINLDKKDVSRHINILPDENLVSGIKQTKNDGEMFQLINLSKQKDYNVLIPLNDGTVIEWQSYAPQKRIDEWISEGKIFVGRKKVPYVKSFLKDELQGQKPSNIIESNVATTKAGSIEIRDFFGSKNIFSYPKPSNLLKRLAKIASINNSIILDFFSGSATTAHAVMQLNAEDGGNRKFIMVQIPEEIDPKKSKAAYDFCVNELKQEPVITTIGKERIKRAANKIKQENESKLEEKSLDLGFKLFKIKSIPEKYIERMKNENNELLITKMLSDEELQALLITWKTYDGYPLTKDLEIVKLDNYESYVIESTLYLVNTGFKLENLLEFIKKLDSERNFVINKIVIFGYHFSSDILLTIKDMIITYKNKKSIELDVEVRY